MGESPRALKYGFPMACPARSKKSSRGASLCFLLVKSGTPGRSGTGRTRVREIIRSASLSQFVSGRVIEAAIDHRRVTQRRKGRQAWEWKRSDALVPGDRVPLSLAADYFGAGGRESDGYFVGAMLGDGGMTSCTPEFHGDPSDGVVQFMREFAVEHGCGVREIPQGSIVRLRFPFRAGHRNPLTDCLRRFKVWGQRRDEKRLPDVPLSRDFWAGCLSGLIDTDGCVRQRVNPRGTLHGVTRAGGAGV